MTLLAAEVTVDGTSARAVGGAYDSTKWNVTTLIRKYTGAGASPNFVGGIPPSVFRPVESSMAKAGTYILSGFKWDDTYDWIFMGDGSTAANTRQIQLWTFNKTVATNPWAFVGYITLTLPYRTAAAAVTMRGMIMNNERYTTGLASCAGGTPNVVGNGTAWQASRLGNATGVSGTRIGFGSTDPTQISTWYEISTVTSATAIALTGNGPNTGGDVAYVIDEWRCYCTFTNATPANGSGLFVAKGLRPELFTGGGTTIPAATTIDNARAVYWMSDAAVTQVHNVPMSLWIRPKADWNTHYAYYLDAHSNYDISKFNLRAALTLTAGVDPANAWVYATGTMTLTGTAVSTNCGLYANLGHGPASGVDAFYWPTTTRIVCTLESSILSAGVAWQNYLMTEVPPGGVNTFAATTAMNQVCYDSMIDRLIITTSGATGYRNYVTQYRNDGGQLDHVFLCDLKQIDQGIADSTITPFHCSLGAAVTMINVNGILYILVTGTTAATNIGHTHVPGIHWAYASTKGQRLVCPKMSTPNCAKFQRAYVIRDRIIGGDNLGQPPEPLSLLYRTSGIGDDSGAWNAVPDGNDLTGISGAAEIQFAIDFRSIGAQSIPARVFSVGVVYNDLGNDYHYQASAKWSDTVNKRFGWRFATGFGGTVPTLYVRLYDAVTKTLLLTDDTVSSGYGTWEKSTNDGVGWGAYNTTDKANEITFIRYTPTTLTDGQKVVFVISQS